MCTFVIPYLLGSRVDLPLVSWEGRKEGMEKRMASTMRGYIGTPKP